MWFKTFLSRLGGLFEGNARRDRELRAEIDAHIAEAVDEFTRQGMSPADARQTAMRQFGGVTQTVETHRERRGFSFFSTLAQDLRYAVRTLRRQPGFALTAVLTLAAGISLNTTLATMFAAMLWQPWPVPDVARVNQVTLVRPEDRRGRAGELTWTEYRQLADHAQTASIVATGCGMDGRIASCRMHRPDGTAVLGQFVSGNYFSALGIPFATGRGFGEIDDRPPAAAPAAVISYQLWLSEFRGAQDVTNRSIEIDGISLAIVGVVADGFLGMDLRRDIWVPLAAAPVLRPSSRREISGLSLVAVRREGVPRAQTEGELTTLIQPRSADGQRIALYSTSMFSSPNDRDETRIFFGVAFAGAFMVLLIACANVGNLILARSAARSHETAIRMSIGAGAGRLVRQFLTESLLLAGLGSSVGLAVAYGAPDWILRKGFESADVSSQLAFVVRPDWRIAIFSVGLALVTCIACGLAPALQAVKPGVANALKSRNVRLRGGATLRAWMLGVQVAASVLLLGISGTLVRSVHHAVTVDRGFNADGVLVMSFELPAAYSLDRRQTIEASLIGTMQPFIDGGRIAVSTNDPFSGRINYVNARVDSTSEPQGRPVSIVEASFNYLAVLGVNLKAGRFLLPSDAGRHRIVINEAFARRERLGSQVLGRVVYLAEFDEARAAPHEVIGVAATVDHGEGADAAVYETLGPTPEWRGRTEQIGLPRLIVRGDAAVATMLGRVAAGLDPGLRVGTIPLQSAVASRFREDRFTAWIAGVVGLLSLVLASIGVAGVFAYFVGQQTRDIGIRIALGARPLAVVMSIVRSGIRPLAIGAAAGLAGSVIASGLLGHSLHGMNPYDPRGYAGVLTILAAAAFVAVALPAWRATCVDPVRVLRSE